MPHAQSWLVRWLGVVGLSLMAVQTVNAQPNIGDVTPRGLQLDGATRIVFQGAGLDQATRLLAPFPIAQQSVVGDATPNRIELEIRLDTQVPPGIHQVWLVNSQGLSAPVLLSVDSLPQLPVTQAVEQLPAALHGTIRGNQVQSVPFPVSEGQRIVVDVQAKRLGGALQPVVRLFDPQGHQIAAGNPQPELQGDVRLEFTAPMTGTMSLEVQDLLLRGAMPGHYKLSLGELRYASVPWPIGVSIENAASAQAKLIGGHVDGSAVHPGPIVTSGWYGMRVEPPQGYVGAQPRQFVGRTTEWTETDLDPDTPATVALPVGISGTLSAAGEHDRFRLTVPKGKQLAIEVWADRLGSDIDPVAVVRIPGAQELGRGDDAAGSRDPQFQVDVPQDQETIEIEIWDLLGRGDAAHAYRVQVADAAAPSLNLDLQQDSLSVSPDGSAILVIPVNRQRFQGDVQLKLAPEIPGIEVSGGFVPADSDRGLLRLRATENAQPAVTQLVAETQVEGLGVVAAQRSPSALSPLLPWQDRTLAVAPTGEVGMSLEVPTLTADTVLWQGGVLRFPVTVHRTEEATGPVRLQLLTTQQMPRKKIKKDNQEEEVDAVEQALRLDELVMVDAKTDTAELPLAVPVDLKPGVWGVAVVGERLTDDKMRVISSAVTDVVFPQVKQALSLTVAGEKKFDVTLGEPGTGTFSGTITRHNGFAGPVVVTLSGLPQMMEVPEVELTAEQTDFELPVSLGGDVKPEQLQTLRIVAQAWDADGYLIAESPSERVTIVLVEKKEE